MKKLITILFFSLFSFGLSAQIDTERILAIGRNALYFEDYVLSIQYFNQVIKIKPHLAEPYMYRAIAKIQLGDDKGAIQDATESINRNPFVPQAYYVRGFASRRLKFYNEAIADFTKAYEFSPEHTYLLLNRMDSYIQLENYDAAIADLNSYMKVEPKNNLYYEKGMIQLAMKDTLAAEISFQENIKRDSTSSTAWSALGLLRMLQEREDDAYLCYSRAIKQKSSFAGDYINRGVLNVQRNNYREALADYDRAIKLDSKNELAFYNRALLRIAVGDLNNALTDLEKVLQFTPDNMDAIYRKALLENDLGMYKDAIASFKYIINRHKYFLPAYYGIADAYNGLRNEKEAFRYRKLAFDMDKNKEEIQKNKEKIDGETKIAQTTPESRLNKRSELFNPFDSNNQNEERYERRYADERRGTIQNKYTDVVNEKNFVITYYAKKDELKRTNLYVPFIENYNKKRLLPADLKITNNEIPLTTELIDVHFERINNISSKIEKEKGNADWYFYRALEFYLIQDFNSAMADLNKALSLRDDFDLAYFCRAVILNKIIDYQKNNPEEDNYDNNKTITADKLKFDTELIIRDYDKLISLHPNFAFAHYNRANILCTQKDFRAAIASYTRAIACDADFAEAYFNRGLTYLFIGEDASGLADLSKAGELGIYQAYNLLKRFGKFE